MPIQTIRRFLALQSSGGIVLVASAALALVAANLPWTRDLYEGLLQLPVSVRVGDLRLDKNVLLLINDGLMAIFFLLIGLEVKREVLEGELSRPEQIVLPGVSALGGIAVPALIYTMINRGDSAALQGWAIPAATDIAFSLGVLSLFSRVPLSLKVFLTTVAIIDDLAAIVIIAIFYTEKLSIAALTIAAIGIVALAIMNRFGVSRIAAYMTIGVVVWVAVLKSGVHATLAGVAVAAFIPLHCKRSKTSPLHDFEHALHPWVAYFILPLFAFANAGVALNGVTSEVLTSGLSLGILAGLAVGKPVGVFLPAAALIGMGRAKLPEGSNILGLVAISALTGIGFTMSLFIGTLAFDAASDTAVAIRVGVFGGSLLAAGLGTILLKISLRSTSQKATPESADEKHYS